MRLTSFSLVYSVFIVFLFLLSWLSLPFYFAIFNFNVLLYCCKVLYEYLSPRLNLNIQNLQAQDEDGNAQIKRLITSTVIASLLVAHKMMTYLLTPEMKDLLECLRVTYNDPRRQSCSEYDAIMRNFPKKEHRR